MTLPPSPNPLPTTEGDGWLLENTDREFPEWLCFVKPQLPKDQAIPRMWMEMTTDANKAFKLSSKADAVTLKALINIGHAKWLEPTHHKWISAPTTEVVTQTCPAEYAHPFFVYDFMPQKIMFKSDRGDDSMALDVLQVRGWGHLTGHGEAGLRINHEAAAAIQDNFGKWVAKTLTDALTAPLPPPTGQ